MSFVSQHTPTCFPRRRSLLELFGASLAALAIALLGACSDDPDLSGNDPSAHSSTASAAVAYGKDADQAQFDLRLRLEIGSPLLNSDASRSVSGLAEHAEPDQLLERVRRPFLGDLDKIRERRFLRVLVSYGRTNFFFDQGSPRGFEYDLMMAVSYTHLPSPRDLSTSRMPSSA